MHVLEQQRITVYPLVSLIKKKMEDFRAPSSLISIAPYGRVQHNIKLEAQCVLFKKKEVLISYIDENTMNHHSWDPF